MLTNHEERFRPGLNNSDHGSDDASDNENGTSKHGHRDMYPLVQVANPRYGQAMGEDGQLDPNPTMLVYRPWSAHDRKKATSDIARPSAQGGSAEEFIREMRGVCDSYMLNGHEIYDCLRDVLKNDWCRVSGDFNGSDANGGPRPNGDNDLQLALNALYDRVRAMWPPRVDYSKIGETQQKEDESPADYRYRLEVVFQANSGIQPNNDANSPYQQQLKMHFLRGLKPEIKSRIDKTWVHKNTGSVAQAVEQAMHADSVIKEKNKRATFTVDEAAGTVTVAYQGRAYGGRRGGQNRDRGKGRGRGGGRYQQNRDNHRETQKEKDMRENNCYKCHRPGHLARVCKFN
ncbi:hypothetical protein D5F01_LYC02364 [Larimichthys crocea]|uniref:CCHC-type domain-containing protein n=1 Tax=Larimichthys crocea TaxID=215358 RepID=A0A6G0J289_LARCR|nr:hypothetical protein D5F01_LYC02364 [Larimichthys crocea]